MTDTEKDNAVVESFERHVREFIRSGAPIVFGRLEGMREVLEIYGRTEELATIDAILKDHHEPMAAKCDEYVPSRR